MSYAWRRFSQFKNTFAFVYVHTNTKCRMAISFNRLSSSLYKNILRRPTQLAIRSITVTSRDCARRIVFEENGDETIIKGVNVASPRQGFVVNTPETTIHKTACPLCRLNLRGLNHTDTLILNQFLLPNGKVMELKDTKLCHKQYRLVKTLISQAQRCNIMKRPSDYLITGPWHDMNTYVEKDRRRDRPIKVVKPEYWKYAD